MLFVILAIQTLIRKRLTELFGHFQYKLYYKRSESIYHGALYFGCGMFGWTANLLPLFHYSQLFLLMGANRNELVITKEALHLNC